MSVLAVKGYASLDPLLYTHKLDTLLFPGLYLLLHLPLYCMNSSRYICISWIIRVIRTHIYIYIILYHLCVSVLYVHIQSLYIYIYRYVQPHSIDSKGIRSRIALRGPLVNLIIFWISLLPFWVGLSTGSPVDNAEIVSRNPSLWSGLALNSAFQLVVFFTQLLPFPGFDGFDLIMPWLVTEVETW